jgi:hypothetical protein
LWGIFTKACSRKQRTHALGSTVKAISEDALDPISRLLLERRALKLPIGLGKGRSVGMLGVAKVPDDTATDNRGKVHFLLETVAMLLIGKDIDRQREPTPP